MKNSNNQKNSDQSGASTLTAKYDVNGDYSSSSSSASKNSKTSTQASKAKYGTLTATEDANNDYQS